MAKGNGSPTIGRAEREIAHGRLLAQEDVERTWGWGTPAGKLRAQRRAELIASGAGLEEGKLALEIGCGSGLFTSMFAETGATLVAVDISPDLLEMARARGLPEDRVTFAEKRFEECDLEGPFDAVIGSSVLHHLELAQALQQIFDLLTPGGVVSFAEPNMLNPQVFLERRFRGASWMSHISPDETAFVRWKLAAQLRAAGFQEVSITPFDWLHPSTPSACIGLVKIVGALVERLPAAREFAGSLHIVGRRPS
jgi:2-polyprenyl-3-methyl-5-hydroxy-6-metoxy-1,4-benzoquinol methylase